MRLSDPGEFADAYSAAALDFARLPHMLHPVAPLARVSRRTHVRRCHLSPIAALRRSDLVDL